MKRGHGARSMVALAAGAALLALPARQASADSIEHSLSDAKWAFEQHAKSWMADLEKNEARNRSEAPVYSVANESVIRFAGYGDDFETQVKPTGRAQTPFVGILRYKENLYTCLHQDESRCTVTRSIPVSEIFSFRNGRWTY
ncbi:MAG: hypothetical protein HKP30_14730 [Myxococcales bacterium]|nr:hypothetical protein [Myxococcales bacterium]